MAELITTPIISDTLSVIVGLLQQIMSVEQVGPPTGVYQYTSKPEHQYTSIPVYQYIINLKTYSRPW